jgi:hypothetical protein
LNNGSKSYKYSLKKHSEEHALPNSTVLSFTVTKRQKALFPKKFQIPEKYSALTFWEILFFPHYKRIGACSSVVG